MKARKDQANGLGLFIVYDQLSVLHVVTERWVDSTQSWRKIQGSRHIVADINPAISQQILNIPVAQLEPRIEPNRISRWKLNTCNREWIP